MQNMMYLDRKGILHEILFRFQREIKDQNRLLYRFQVYYGNQTFACDFTISKNQINTFGLTDTELRDIFYKHFQRIIENNIKEYHTIDIKNMDVKSYPKA